MIVRDVVSLVEVMHFRITYNTLAVPGCYGCRMLFPFIMCIVMRDIVPPTLLSKATATSKTFIVPKVFTIGCPDWFCLKAPDLPFIHAKFHSSGSSGLASTWF